MNHKTVNLDELTKNKVIKLVGDFKPSPVYIRLCPHVDHPVYVACGITGKGERLNKETTLKLLQNINDVIKFKKVINLAEMEAEQAAHLAKLEGR